jgi:hypothetical protein
MKKIRIPRKLKKHNWEILDRNSNQFPNVPKLRRYYDYLAIEWGIKLYNMSPEELVHKFARYTMDHVIWWNWVRWKEFGIAPEMSKKYQEYWNYFVENGAISAKTLFNHK